MRAFLLLPLLAALACGDEEPDMPLQYHPITQSAATNPDTPGPWSWADVDLYQWGIGITMFPDGTAPTVIRVSQFLVTVHGTGGETLVLRPTGPGFVNDMEAVGEVNAWECVDEAVSDDDATYMEATTPTAVNATDKTNFFTLANHGAESWPIARIEATALIRVVTPGTVVYALIFPNTDADPGATDIDLLPFGASRQTPVTVRYAVPAETIHLVPVGPETQRYTVPAGPTHNVIVPGPITVRAIAYDASAVERL